MVVVVVVVMMRKVVVVVITVVEVAVVAYRSIDSFLGLLFSHFSIHGTINAMTM